MTDPYSSLPPGHNVPISIKPFASLDLNDDDELRDWLKQAVEQLTQYYGPYRRIYRDNIYTYVGSPIDDGFLWQWNGGAYDQVRPTRRKTRLNIIQPIVESHLSRLISTRASISVLPTHSAEYKDLASAKTVERVIEMSWRDRKINSKMEAAARNMLVCGSSYIWVKWNEDIGPKLEDVDSELRGSRELPMLDDMGEPMLDEDGNVITIRTDFRLGDVDYCVLRPDQVLEQPRPDAALHEKDWVVVVELMDVYKVREKYPQLADEIRPGDWAPGIDDSQLLWHMHDSEHQVMVMTLMHRATPSLPNGFVLTATPDVVLEAGEMPFEALNKAGLFPLARLDDTVPPGYEMPLPMTVMEAGKSYQSLFNSLNNNILRNLSMSAPKWLVHHGSGVRRAHLSNDASIVPYKGMMKPEVIAPNFNHIEAFTFRDKLLEEMRLNTGAAHVFNNPPPNTRAAEMLQHHEEQEYRRAEPLIRHVNDFQACLAKIAVAIMASKYDEDDGRALRLFGPGGASVMLKLQVADLSGPYDVRFERTSALPESKQGRLNEAARLYELGMIDKEQYRKVIGYDSDPDLQTPEAKAYEYQLFRNDLLRYGHQIAEPLEHEDHIESLKALYPIIMSVEFAEMPPELKERFIAETMAREMFAWKKAQMNPGLQAKLSTLAHFPCFFTALPSMAPVIDPATALQTQAMKDAPRPALGVTPPPQPGGPGAPEGS